MAEKETVLVAGASGNIGISVIITALRRNMNVLALVRSKKAGEKIFQHLNIGEDLPTGNVTLVETDVTSENESGVQGVVEKVKKGELPEFQHVYSTGISPGRPLCVRGLTTLVGFYFRAPVPIHEVDMADIRSHMQVSFYANFFVYKYTIPYLLSLGKPTTFTIITGGSRNYGTAGIAAVGQGALASLAAVGARELEDTNVRFNEVYLAFRVEYDSVLESGEGPEDPMWATKWTKASDFARVYDRILRDDQIRGSQVNVVNVEDMDGHRYQDKCFL